MEELVKNTLERIPAAIIVVGSDNIIKFANKHLLEMFGWGPELVGEKLSVLMPKRFRAKHQMLVAGYLQNPTLRIMGSDNSLPIWAVTKDGEEFRIKAGLSWLGDPPQEGLALITWDRIQVDREDARQVGDQLGDLEYSLRKFRKHIQNLHGDA